MVAYYQIAGKQVGSHVVRCLPAPSLDCHGGGAVFRLVSFDPRSDRIVSLDVTGITTSTTTPYAAIAFGKMHAC